MRELGTSQTLWAETTRRWSPLPGLAPCGPGMQSPEPGWRCHSSPVWTPPPSIPIQLSDGSCLELVDTGGQGGTPQHSLSCGRCSLWLSATSCPFHKVGVKQADSVGSTLLLSGAGVWAPC